MGNVGMVAIYPHYDASFQVILVSPRLSPHLKGPTTSHAFPEGMTIYKFGGQTYALFEQI